MQLDQLYRAAILEHARDPGNQQGLEHPQLEAEAVNHLCGDKLVLGLDLEEGKISRVGLQVRACALTCASASIMRAAIQDQPLTQVVQLGEAFRHGLEVGDNMEQPEALKPLLALKPQGGRHKCLLLPWQALADCAAGVKHGE